MSSVRTIRPSGLDRASEVQASHDFSQRIEPLWRPLFFFFQRRVDPHDDAYDCVSETLAVMWKRYANAPISDDELRAWSFGIAKKVLANYSRSRNRQRRLTEKSREVARPEVSESSESSLDVSGAMAALRPIDRELVSLIVWDGFGVAEAGAVLGIRAEAARARYSRARLALRDYLNADEPRE